MKPDEKRLRRALWDAAERKTYATIDLAAIADSLGMPWKRAYYISTKMPELEGGCSDRFVWFRAEVK